MAQLAYRPAAGRFLTAATPTPADATEHARRDAVDVAFKADGELLTTWADHYPKQDRTMARWIASSGIGPAITLDRAASNDVVLSLPTGHAALLTTQGHRTPDRHGRILVPLRCVSFDRDRCVGTLKLTAGPRRRSAGRKRFAIRPGAVKRIRVTLSSRARRTLRRRGRITLTATAVTTAPDATFGGTKARIVVTR